MKKFRLFQLILVLLLLPGMVLPVRATQTVAPVGDPTIIYGAQTPDGQNPVMGSERTDISARSAILYELTSDTLVYAWNVDAQLEPSSLTKIMTALLAVEQVEDLSETVTVDWEVLISVPSNAMLAGLFVGETVTVEQLIYLMMVGSANDAACVIADYVGGDQETFVAMMNQRAMELGCTGTRFLNAHGIHEQGHVSTARDMLKILRKAMEYPTFVEIFNTESYVLEATNMSPERYFESTNYMGSTVLTEDYFDSRVTGGRTGNTDEGYRNLAAAAEEDGTVYLTVVLESESVYADNGVMIRQGAFEDTGTLLDMGFDQCSAVQVVYEGQALDQMPVTGGDSHVAIGPMETATSVMPKTMDVSQMTSRIQLSNPTLSAPVSAGTYVGEYQVYYGNRCIANIPIYTLHDVQMIATTAASVTEPEDPGFDPGALTTAMTVLSIIFAVILLLFGGLFLVRWFRTAQAKGRKQKRRAGRRRSR